MATPEAGTNLLQATQLSKFTDVRREVVAGALNQLQAAISQGASPSQQSLLTLFRFAEAVFSCPSCPWPHTKQEFEMLTKGMTKILGQAVERLMQGDPQLALLACERLVRLDRIAASDATLVLVWRGVVQLATAHHKSLAQSFQCEEVLASLLSYVEDGEVKIRSVVKGLERGPAAGADPVSEYGKASRVLAFFLLRIALIVRAYGGRLSPSTLERVCRVLCLLRGWLDPCLVPWLVALQGHGAVDSPAMQVQKLVCEGTGLLGKVEQTFLKTLATEGEAEEAGQDEAGHGDQGRQGRSPGLAARVLSALVAACDSLMRGGKGVEGEGMEAAGMGALRLLGAALRLSAEMPHAAHAELCRLLATAVPAIIGVLYPSCVWPGQQQQGEPLLAYLLGPFAHSAAAHLARASATCSMLVQDTLFGQLFLSGPHPVLRELWLSVWHRFLRACAAPTRCLLVGLIMDMTEAPAMAVDRRAWAFRALPQLLAALDSPDRVAFTQRMAVRCADRSSWHEEAGLFAARMEALQLCAALMTEPDSCGLVQPLADALLASPPPSPRQELAVLQVVVTWHSVLPQPSMLADRLASLASAKAAVAPPLLPGDWATVLRLTAALLHALGTTKVLDILSAVLAVLSSSIGQSRMALATALPAGLSELTHRILDDAQLRTDAKVASMLEKVWSWLASAQQGEGGAGGGSCVVREAMRQSTRSLASHAHLSEAGSALAQVLASLASPPATHAAADADDEAMVSSLRAEAQVLRGLKTDVLLPPSSSTPTPAVKPASSSAPPPNTPTMELRLGTRAFLLPLSKPSATPSPSDGQTFGVLLLSRDVSDSVTAEEARQLLMAGMVRPADGTTYGVDLEEGGDLVLRLAKRPRRAAGSGGGPSQ